MLRRISLAAAAALAMPLLLGLPGCDDVDRDIGTPCEVEQDCPEPLICDVHDSQGSCQRDHDHGQVSEESTFCTVDDDCEFDMVCDIHDGEGWCTPPHDHDTETSG